MSSGVQVLKGSDVKYEFRDGNVIPHAATDWIYFYGPDKASRPRIELLHSFPVSNFCLDAQFSHDGNIVAFNDGEDTHLHGVSTGDLITTFRSPQAVLHADPDCYSDENYQSGLHFSADDRLLAVGSFTGFITVCEAF